MTTVEQWGLFEISLQGPLAGNPFLEVELTATFRHKERCCQVTGFYDGEGLYRVRFMPDLMGTWTYTTTSSVPGLNGRSGTMLCTPASPSNHGPVSVTEKYHFRYADGSPYYPFGTTCYAWIHQPIPLQQQTLETLRKAPFNKMRMCVFPKSYEYNQNEPELFVFEGTLQDGFDHTRFNPHFFQLLERRVLELQQLGIECDLILFHPYDRWGFSDLGPEKDERYLRYLVARLAAFRNVWWSMANEYDMFLRPDGSLKKTFEDWERLARTVQAQDPFHRLQSIHNCLEFYDHNRPWISHCSLQRVDHAKTSENTTQWRNLWEKPVVIDECGYEGNIHHGWGNIPGQEMTRRFWEGFVRGGYVGHGETYVHPEDILWWSHGGVLHGSSPDRIGFLRQIIEDAPGPLSPVPKPVGALFDPNWDVTLGAVGDEYHLYYFSFCQPAFRRFSMKPELHYRVDVIDTWEMTIVELDGTFNGNFQIVLPGKPFMAIRLTRVR